MRPNKLKIFSSIVSIVYRLKLLDILQTFDTNMQLLMIELDFSFRIVNQLRQLHTAYGFHF
jgi:hypothetical protein